MKIQRFTLNRRVVDFKVGRMHNDPHRRMDRHGQHPGNTVVDIDEFNFERTDLQACLWG